MRIIQRCPGMRRSAGNRCKTIPAGYFIATRKGIPIDPSVKRQRQSDRSRSIGSVGCQELAQTSHEYHLCITITRMHPGIEMLSSRGCWSSPPKRLAVSTTALDRIHHLTTKNNPDWYQEEGQQVGPVTGTGGFVKKMMTQQTTQEEEDELQVVEVNPEGLLQADCRGQRCQSHRELMSSPPPFSSWRSCGGWTPGKGG